MMKNLFYFLRGTISLVLYIVFTFFIAFLVILSSSISLFIVNYLLIYILPQRWHKKVYRYTMIMLHTVPTLWIDLLRLAMLISTTGKWNIEGNGQLKKRGTYLVISNHRSWVDIVVLSRVFNHKIPLLKFFMKKELLWSLPIAGVASYLLGYPFMARHTTSEIRKNPELKGKDIETAKAACRSFREYPASVINFVEGTRFTKAKREKSGSPFQHLLKPKAAGIAIVANELHDKLDGIVNVTVVYDKEVMSFWDFACGRFKNVIVRYEVLDKADVPLGDYYQDRLYRKRFQSWLNQLWEEKDKLIDQFKETVND